MLPLPSTILAANRQRIHFLTTWPALNNSVAHQSCSLPGARTALAGPSTPQHHAPGASLAVLDRTEACELVDGAFSSPDGRRLPAPRHGCRALAAPECRTEGARPGRAGTRLARLPERLRWSASDADPRGALAVQGPVRTAAGARLRLVERDLAMGTAAFSMRPQCHMTPTPCGTAAGSLLHTSKRPNTYLAPRFLRRVAAWAVQGSHELVQFLTMHICDDFASQNLPRGEQTPGSRFNSRPLWMDIVANGSFWLIRTQQKKMADVPHGSQVSIFPFSLLSIASVSCCSSWSDLFTPL